MVRKILTNMKKSVIVTWAISYIVCAVLAAGIMMWTYTGAVETVQQQTKQVNEKNLSRITMQLEHTVSQMQTFSLDIENNDYVKAMMNLTRLDDKRNYYYLDSIRSTYHNSGRVENTFDAWFIYFVDIDTIVSNLGVTDARTFYEVYVNDKIGDFVTWQQSLNEHAKGRFMKTNMDFQDGGSEDYIAYAKGIPFNLGLRTKAIVVSLISQKRLNQLNEMSDGSAELYIIDPNSGLLYGNGNKEAYYTYDSFADETEIVVEQYDKEKYVTAHKITGISKWKCIMVMPFGEYYENISHMRMLLLFGIIFILIGNTAVTCYFVYKNYMPIHAILKDLSYNARDIMMAKNINEYEYIRTNINGIISENDRIKSVLSADNDYAGHNFIKGLLHGVSDRVGDIAEAFKTVGIDIMHNEFCVGVIQIENSNELFSEEEMNDFERHKTAIFIFKNVLEELFDGKYTAHVFEMDEDIICLINLQNGPEVQKNIAGTINKARSFIDVHFKIETTAGIGEVLSGAGGIHISFKEAKNALKLKARLGTRQTILYSVAKSVADMRSDVPEHLVGRFVNTITVYNEKEMENLVAEVLKDGTDIRDAIATVYKIAVSILERYEQNIDYDSVVKEIGLMELLSITDSAELRDWFINAARILYLINEDMVNEFNQDVVMRVCAYVEQHYNDVNMSIDSIGSMFGMTGKRFSRLFTEQKGERFVVYLNRYRIERAKEIINERDVNLEALTNLVGFASQRTFMRLFKTYEGITPGQYKALCKNKK